MKGYISISSDSWCNNLKQMQLSEGVFWRKRKSFNALEPEELFFFLKRSRIKGIRYVVGYASFVENTVLTAEKAWEKYDVSLGAKSRDEFFKDIQGIYQSSEVELGCIVLNNIHFFETGVSLEECGIDFSSAIVSGKVIDESDCRIICQHLGEGKKNGSDIR